MLALAILEEAVKQIPALSVLCFVVWIFLARLALFIEAISKLHKEHLDAREVSRETIKDNSQAMRANTQAMMKLIEEIERIYEQKDRK